MDAYHEHVSGTNFQEAIQALSNYNTHSSAADEPFGDNVGVDKYEYFLEDCRHAADPPNDCMYTEITDPDVY